MLKEIKATNSVCCEVGDYRHTNQDDVLARWGKNGDFAVGMYVVADGCGGMAYGQKVSRLIIDSFSAIWDNELPKLFQMYNNPKDHIYETFSMWIEQINAVAFSFQQQIGEKIGSTLTLLLTIDLDYFIFNVGDSRAYQYRGGELLQLTEDQSLLADMIRNGEIEAKNAVKHIERNILTMCVGGFEKLQSYFISGTICAGDIFMLCSDGLHGALGEDELCSVIPKEITEKSAEELRRKIPYGRAHDNVSVILVQIQ